MLREENNSISEVTYKVGFGSPSYFSKCFHEYFGFPPKEAGKHKIDIPNPGMTKYREKLFFSRGWIKTHLKTTLIVTGTVILILLSYFVYDIFFLNPSESGSNNARRKSIVIMPLKNLSNLNENKYIATGITEDIINQLSGISYLKVYSRTSAEYFHEQHLSFQTLAEKYDIDFILEGSVRRQNNKARVIVQLIDARNEGHIWSEDYDKQLTDILDIQKDIARNVVQELKAVLTIEEKERLEGALTQNASAYNNFLLGRFFQQKRTEKDVKESIYYLNKAIKEDSLFAEAWAELANTIFLQSYWRWNNWTKGFKEAKEYALKALKIDQNLAESQAIIGSIECYGYWKMQKAKYHLEKAVNLKPDFALAHQYYAELLEIINERKEARKEINLAMKLDPVFFMHRAVSSGMYYRDKKYKESLEERSIMLDLNPEYTQKSYRFFYLFLKLGKNNKAVSALQEVMVNDPSRYKYFEAVMEIYQKSGIDGLLNWLIVLEKDKTTRNEQEIARLYALLDDKENALLWLEKAMDKKVPNLPRIAINPDFEILHNEPRFLELIDSMGLTPYHPWAQKLSLKE